MSAPCGQLLLGAELDVEIDFDENADWTAFLNAPQNMSATTPNIPTKEKAINSIVSCSIIIYFPNL